MLEEICRIARNCERVAVLTGAGMSAESGVPTFRGKEGLWDKFRAEELATMDAFLANPEIVWEWYNWRRQLMSTVAPNPGHVALAALEKLFDSFVVITQNVDGLHRTAGSTDILELHGNILRNKCVDCNQPIKIETAVDAHNIPCCSDCGGKVRPDVVWFGEMLNRDTIDRAFLEAERADLFLSVGTSAIVHPAASLPVTARQHGATLVEVNPERTPLTPIADYYIGEPSGVWLPRFLARIEAER